MIWNVLKKTHNTGKPEICVLIVDVAWENPQILITHPQCKDLHSQFGILNPLFSILYLKSHFSNLNSPSSTLPPSSSDKSMGYLTGNILKIAGIPTKCLQAPLAPLAAFSRSAVLTAQYFCQSHTKPQLKLNSVVLPTFPSNPAYKPPKICRKHNIES